MRIESLQPYDDVYQVLDDNDLVLYQGKQVDCMTYIPLTQKRNEQTQTN
jgi:hypothetical protein